MSELALVWLPGGLLAWVYLGYPLVVWLLGRAAPELVVPTGAAPSLTVAIAVHDAASEIQGPDQRCVRPGRTGRAHR